MTTASEFKQELEKARDSINRLGRPVSAVKIPEVVSMAALISVVSILPELRLFVEWKLEQKLEEQRREYKREQYRMAAESDQREGQ